jgi:predicted transport protein
LPLYSVTRGKLAEIDEVNVDKERNVQRLIEGNLHVIFGLEFIDSEFALDDLRIDTLAYDAEAKAFVIIEYKKKTNDTVVDQGYAYLNLMITRKADFILKYYEKTGKHISNIVEWDSSKVIFVAPSFTAYQKQAIKFKDLPFELWEVKHYSNGTILFSQLKTPEKGESIKTLGQKNSVIRAVSREITAATEESNLEIANDAIKALYVELKEAILSMGSDIELKPKKLYIAFVRKTNFVDIEFYKSHLKLFINMKKGTLNDPQKKARDVSNVGHHGNGDYEITLKDTSDVGYVMSLVRQSYDKNSDVRAINERINIREKVNAVLNPDDQTQTRRKEIS